MEANKRAELSTWEILLLDVNGARPRSASVPKWVFSNKIPARAGSEPFRSVQFQKDLNGC